MENSVDDRYLANPDVRSQHTIEVFASPEEVFLALETVSLGDSRWIRWLFRLRGLPTDNLTLEALKRIRFYPLERIADQSLILGIIGKFWTVTGSLRRFDTQGFLDFTEPGFAKATWSFRVNPPEEAGQDITSSTPQHLVTETRVKATSSRSRKLFLLYWTVIGPFSGLIRREMLRLVKEKAERGRLKGPHLEPRSGDSA